MEYKKLVKLAFCGIAVGIISLGCTPSDFIQRYESENNAAQQTESAVVSSENPVSEENGSQPETRFPQEKKMRAGKKILSRNHTRTAETNSTDNNSNTRSSVRFSSEAGFAFNDTKQSPAFAEDENKGESSVRYSSSLAGRAGKSGTNSSEEFKDKKDFKLPDYLEEDGADEDLPVEAPVDISKLLKEYSSDNSENCSPDSVNCREKIMMEVIKYLNTPYQFGGNTKYGIDCSAFTRTVFNNSFAYGLPRSAREQYQVGQEVDGREDLKFGDLVFFNTRRGVRPGHVGIYLGHNLFAHASSHLGVTVSSLDSTYYNNRYMGGRRMDVIASASK